MNICIRCGHKCDGEIHIFRGGEYTRQLTELQIGMTVSLCSNGIPDDEFDTWTDTFGYRDPTTTFAEMEESSKKILEKLDNFKNSVYK